MAIVSCPECLKKLKVADTSVGKKVKCSCGTVFVAEPDAAAPVKAAAPAPAADKVVVACTECGAKLKVASSSLGKRMKCPKCAEAFVAAAEEEAAPPPPKKAAKPAPKPAPDDDEFDPPAPAKKAKAVSDDDMDELFSFAQGDAEAETRDNDSPFADDDEMPRLKGKSKAKKVEVDEDEDDFPPPKSKFGAKKPVKPSRKFDDDDDEAPIGQNPVYPSRTLLNLFVLFLLLIFIAGFAVVFLEVVHTGLPKSKGFIKAKKQETDDEKKKRLDAEAAENKKEFAKLNGTWVVESAEKDGKAIEDAKGKKFTFADAKATTPTLKNCTFEVDATKDPKWLDINSALPNLTTNVQAIYKFDGDKLELCAGTTTKINKDGKEDVQAADRPKDFDSKQGTLYVLKREKKEEKKTNDAANKAEASKLNGAWVVESATMQKNSLDAMVGMKFVFTDGMLTTEEPFTAPFTVDASKSPKWIELPISDKVKVPGIYALDGDKLQWCIAIFSEGIVDGKKTIQFDRPKEFDAKQGILVVLRRDKKGGVKAPDKTTQKPTPGVKEQAAQAQANVLTKAVQAYAVKNDGQFPPTLLALLEKDAGGPYLANPDALRDPWGKEFQYNVSGNRNKGNHPDIWTVSPDQQTIGNWPAEKVKDKNGKQAASVDVGYGQRESTNNLKQIGLALHSHFDATKHLPAAGSTDESGKPLLSWRVALLPYLEEVELYKEFDLNKPWDDPHNMKLVAKMPKIYMVPGVEAKAGMTHYRTPVGPGTLLKPMRPMKGQQGKSVAWYKLTNIPDGASNIIAVVEAKEPTIWTKPDDLTYDPKAPLVPMLGVVPTGFNVLFANGLVVFVDAKVPEAVLRPYFSGSNAMPRQPLDGKEEKKGKDFDKNEPNGQAKDKESEVVTLDLLSEQGDRPTWTVPKGWKEAKGNAFTVAAFAVEDKGQKISVTVTPLSGKGGGLLANANRWRAQLKLPAWSEQELAKNAKKRKIGGIESHYLELTDTKSATTILGAIVFREDQVWFFKLTGDAALANREKDNFSKFLDSVKFK